MNGLKKEKMQGKSSRQIYLAGSIEAAKNCGRDWREIADRELRFLGYSVYNPSTDEQKILEPFGLKTAEELHKLKNIETLGRYREIGRGITEYDLEKLE